MLERSLKSLGIVPEPNLIAVGFKDKYFMTPGINFWPFEKPALVCRYRLVCHNKESKNPHVKAENPLDEMMKKLKNKSENNELIAQNKKSEKLVNLENVYKKVELNMNKAIPYLKAILTKDIGLKYAPDIRFQRDNFAKEFSFFEENLQKMNHAAPQTKANQLIEIFIEPLDCKFLKALYFLIHENKEYLQSYFEQIENGDLDINTLFR